MSDTLLPCEILEPDAPARSAVIWLHGLGADGHDFVPIVPHLGVRPEHAVRFVFPHAPAIPVTLNGGMVMPAWYDITSLDLQRRGDGDTEGIRRSAARIRELIAAQEAEGIPSERIVLAGFSQGGAIALYLGLRFPRKLAGILGLSTYLVRADDLPAERSEANADTPILLAHGEHDPMVPFAAGVWSRDRLRKLGSAVEWRQYPMQHEVCMEEIADVGTWLNQVLERGSTA